MIVIKALKPQTIKTSEVEAKLCFMKTIRMQPAIQYNFAKCL